jgi:hypothetical protein
VVKVFDLNTRQDPAYLVMEYVPGGTLADLAAGGPLPARQALPILADVAEALRSMADQGVVHRDIKPNNVFVLPDGSAKLGDFGLARALVDDSSFRTAAGVPVGTPAYFPPEVSQGTTAPDHQSDAYSFAVMAYEVLTGVLPFRADNAIAMIAAHWGQPPRPASEALPGIPARAAEALHAGLAKQPGTRPLPFELVEVLRSIPDHEWPEQPSRGAAATVQPESAAPPVAVSAPPGPPSATTFVPPTRWRRRGTLAIAGVMVAAGCLAGLLVPALRGPSDGLEIRSVMLAVSPDASGRCPLATYHFTASITTNGAGGELRISWVRPDGLEVPAKVVGLERDTTKVRAELEFTFRGSAALSGEVVVRIAGDDTATASRTITYDCGAERA